MSQLQEWLTSPQFAPLTGLPVVAIRERMAATINLMDNITRGLLGEVLVAHATGGEITAPWDPWDVVLPNGLKIEVKTTGLVQAWTQPRISVPRWSIAAAAAWQVGDAGYIWNPEQRRRSDWYIFALHDGVQPGHTEEWTFRPVETHRLDSLAGARRVIGISSLDDIFHPEVLTFVDLKRWL